MSQKKELDIDLFELYLNLLILLGSHHHYSKANSSSIEVLVFIKWCGEWDSNPRTPTGQAPEACAFDLQKIKSSLSVFSLTLEFKSLKQHLYFRKQNRREKHWIG